MSAELQPERPPGRAHRFGRWLLGRDVDSARITWLFLRLLGLIYTIAFASYGVQALGLIGSEGILPTHGYLDSAGADLTGVHRWLEMPTLLWLSAGDGAIRAVCVAGTALGALLTIGLLPLVVLPLLWLLYLSLVNADPLFLGYQWDALLLEVGFAAIFLARWGVWPRPPGSAPPRLALVATRFILFRLYFLSAVVKWLAHTSYWRNFTALNHHFQTQPIPNPLAYWAQHWPSAFHEIGVLATLLIEGPVAVLVLGPKWLRRAAFLPMVGLQLLIALTGNYGFFNLLALSLCLLLLDDKVLAWLGRLFRRGRAVPPPPDPEARARAARLGIPAAVLAALLLMLQLGLGSLYIWRDFDRHGGGVPEPALRLASWLAPFYIVNSYGLFSDMTPRRPEIIVEGSLDGQHWVPYVFRDKAGAPDRAPPWVGPHMPRLDWQMWFAALAGDCRASRGRWYLAFARRLLEGSPTVLGLLQADPFQGQPPRYLRSTLWDYRFTDPSERAATGNWWQREDLGPYCPILQLNGDRLAVAHLAR